MVEKRASMSSVVEAVYLPWLAADTVPPEETQSPYPSLERGERGHPIETDVSSSGSDVDHAAYAAAPAPASPQMSPPPPARAGSDVPVSPRVSSSPLARTSPRAGRVDGHQDQEEDRGDDPFFLFPPDDAPFRMRPRYGSV